MRGDPTFWMLARASGLTAYLLLTASVVAGLVVKSRPFGRAVKAAERILGRPLDAVAADLEIALSLEALEPQTAA